MTSADGPPPAADTVLRCFEERGVTHVIGLPDNASAALFDGLARHPRIRLVYVTREGEAFAIAAGLWMGGASPVVVVQNTGLLESGDSLRGTAVRMAVPLVMLIGYRGHARLVASGLDPGSRPLPPDAAVRPDLDTAALHTEPTLAAWGVAFALLRGNDDVAVALAAAFDRAGAEQRPVALLITRGLV